MTSDRFGPFVGRYCTIDRVEIPQGRGCALLWVKEYVLILQITSDSELSAILTTAERTGYWDESQGDLFDENEQKVESILALAPTSTAEEKLLLRWEVRKSWVIILPDGKAEIRDEGFELQYTLVKRSDG
jgi:hypothetical protein